MNWFQIKVMPLIGSANFFYLSFIYFRLFWVATGAVESPELLDYKYALYSIFTVYPVLIFSVLIFHKSIKVNFLLKLLSWCLCALIAYLYFATFDLFQNKELFYGYLFLIIQSLLQSQMVGKDEIRFRIAAIYAGRLLAWFLLLLLSLVMLSNLGEGIF